MPLGVPRAGRDHHAAELLQPVVQAEAAGEHAVAERHLRPVARHHAGHLGQARDAVAPHVHVVGVVSHHDGLSRGARRRVQFHHLVHWHGEQAVGERFAQHGLVRERKLPHVLERADVVRRHAELVHARTVPRHAPVGPGHLGLELFQLHSADLLARGALDGGFVDGQAGEVAGRHGRERGALDGQVGHPPHLPPSAAPAAPKGFARLSCPTSSTGSCTSSSSARTRSFTDRAI